MRINLTVDGVPSFDRTLLTADSTAIISIRGKDGAVFRFVADVKHVKDQGEVVTVTADYDEEVGKWMGIVATKHTSNPNHDK